MRRKGDIVKKTVTRPNFFNIAVRAEEVLAGKVEIRKEHIEI